MDPKSEQELLDGVAVIGMAGRFPGAQNVDFFWENLINGRESITFFPPDGLSPLIPSKIKQNPHYVPARGILDNIDLFDADFFNIPPLEAQVMDPQQRIFLELCWEGLENAGYAAEDHRNLTGVFAGMNNNSYYLKNVLKCPESVEKIGEFQAMLANEKDFLATRASYKLNLRGPSVNIYTACSTGLTAIISAFQSLMTYQCDMALAGGVSITVPQNSGYLYQEGSMLSPDGHCRPFDENSQGTTFNNGAGVVVLKRHEEAVEDGDHILAVIRGTGLNNDGSERVSFTAPSVEGQQEAIAMALAQAEVAPETISYVETHGTATPMGDPIEVSALTQAFSIAPDKGKTCLIGSVKSNIGHLIHAAGVTGFIKTSLALHHKTLPPTLYHKEPTSRIDWDNTPFTVCNKLTDWTTTYGSPRRAGVSSFGVGGTNAHVILEEYENPAPVSSTLPFHLVLFSARSENALKQQAINLHNHIESSPTSLPDLAFTLQNGRKHFNRRCFGVFDSYQTTSNALKSQDTSQLFTATTTRRNPEIVFMFPGQGAQHLQMARGIYENIPYCATLIDSGAEILQPELGLDIRSVLFSDNDADADILTQTRIAQPALFLIEYALAMIWQTFGVIPAAMIGHSIGELTAACLSGVFSFKDGLQLVAKRGALMQQCPTGSMLSVRLSATVMRERLTQDLVLSTINSPQLCVVGGPKKHISTLFDQLQADDIPSQILHTSHAFHTADMEPAATAFSSAVDQLQLSPPKIPFISCATGTWITDEQAVSGEYWGKQILSTVQFSKGMSLALADEERVFLEVGPRTTSATLARQHLAGRKISILSTLDKETSPARDYFSFLQACGHLWLNGTEIKWPEIYANEQRSRIPLPTYPFERKRFWLEPGTLRETELQHVPTQHPNSQHGEPMTSESQKQDIQPLIINQLSDIIVESSGIEIDPANPQATFLELGLDSLFLTQLATTISNQFEVEVTFRQLLDELASPAELADHIAIHADSSLLPATVQQPTTQSLPAQPAVLPANIPTGQEESFQMLLSQQLQIMSRQLEIITGQATAPMAAVPPAPTSPAEREKTSKPTRQEKQKSFGPAAKINTDSLDALTDKQQSFLKKLIKSYTEKTKGSKAFAQKNRQLMADPRTVSGFRPLFKEMIYQLVVAKSSGCTLWDIDGNEYVDMLNGFGSNFLGYSPDFVTKAVTEQMQKGIEIGPQHPLTGDVAKLMAQFTQLDRFAFCNTGSEAVLGCMRIARTVTGRKTIVIFTGAYHGIFDEVIVRGTPALKSFAAAPGINNEAVANTLVLDYGDRKSLQIIKEHSREIAAILVEPVQSRNPALQPKKFLHKLREIATESGAALIIDEVITGFRIHPRGSQGFFDVDADLATYGKVIGGGLPIGIIGGKKRFMDALDGGQWQFGDESFPEVGVTYFAGTFVRHPMALAACRAVLRHLQKQGENLQKTINHRADVFCRKLNTLFTIAGAPLRVDHFGSLMKIQFDEESPFNELLYFLLREKGIHIWDARPIFLTTAHTDEHLELVYKAFTESINQLQTAGFMTGATPSPNDAKHPSDGPPAPGARLGKTPEGDPAWFVPDPDRPGKFSQLS